MFDDEEDFDDDLGEPKPAVKKVGLGSSDRHPSLSQHILAQSEMEEDRRSDRMIAKQKRLKARENQQFAQKAFVPDFGDEDDEDIPDEDVSVRFSKSTGVGVNMDAHDYGKYKKSKSSNGVSRVKRLQ